MKAYYLIPIFCLLIISCNNLRKSVDDKKIIVCGNVDKINNIEGHNMIQLIYDDILEERVTLYDTLDSEGRFSFTIESNHGMTVKLLYSSFLPLYTFPGDSLFLDFDSKYLSTKTKNSSEERQFYRVSGSNGVEEFNNHFGKYLSEFYDKMNSDISIKTAFKIKEPLEYRQFIDSCYQEYKTDLISFNEVNNTSKSFQCWATNFIEYSRQEDLLRYRWVKPFSKGYSFRQYHDSLPKEYFDFINPSTYNNDSLLMNEKYICFMREYYTYKMNTFFWESDSFKQKGKKVSMSSNLKEFREYLIEEENGFVLDVLLAQYYWNALNGSNTYKVLEVYDSTDIKNPYLYTRVHKKYLKRKLFFENPEFTEGINIESYDGKGDYLAYLSKKYPNKVLYIDFWAPWCGPCMNDLPFSQRVKDIVKGDSIVFIYIANNCKEEIWKAVIAEKNLKGEHFLLTDKQYKQISTKYGFNTIPHYMLISKDGEIFKAPSPKDTDTLLDLLKSSNNYPS